MDFHGSHGEVADDMDSHGLGIEMVILPAYHGDNKKGESLRGMEKTMGHRKGVYTYKRHSDEITHLLRKCGWG
jgi:hypothetical protein